MKKQEICVILDNIRSRENVGSIFRTADAVGVKKIYLCGITPTPLSNYELRIANSKNNPQSEISNRVIDKISKTALGAETFVPWEYHEQTWRLLRKLKVKSLKFKVVGLEKTKNSENIFKFKIPKNKKIALVMGNEIKGLSSKILKYCDDVVHIPMRGKKESLNVSVAVGIAVYTLLSSE